MYVHARMYAYAFALLSSLSLSLSHGSASLRRVYVHVHWRTCVVRVEISVNLTAWCIVDAMEKYPGFFFLPISASTRFRSYPSDDVPLKCFSATVPYVSWCACILHAYYISNATVSFATESVLSLAGVSAVQGVATILGKRGRGIAVVLSLLCPATLVYF